MNKQNKRATVTASTRHRGWTEKLTKLGYSSAQAKRMLDKAEATIPILRDYLNAHSID